MKAYGTGGVKKLSSILLLSASLMLVTVGYAGFGTMASASNNSGEMVYVSVNDEGSSYVTLQKLGISITGTTSQFTFNTLEENEYSYSEDSSGNFDLSSESETSYSSTSTIVNGKIKIGLTVNLDPSYDSEAEDNVPNIANLAYDNTYYKYFKVSFGFNSTEVQKVVATVYPTNYSNRYYEMPVANTTSGTTSVMEYVIPLKSVSSTSLYDLATYDSSYPKYSNGTISDYKVPITVEFDCTALTNLATYYGPTSTTTFTATFSIEGDN